MGTHKEAYLEAKQVLEGQLKREATEDEVLDFMSNSSFTTEPEYSQETELEFQDGWEPEYEA